jgi:hypothetical protein
MSQIPSSDERFLKRREFDYSIVTDGPHTLLVIKNWEFPEAYTPRKADLMIILTPGYPMAALDMFWTYPDIKLASNDSWPEACAHHETYAGVSWQRWSRHFQNWRAGIDDLRSFITSVEQEINRGI